jgi:hypothetical protein
MLNTGNNGKSLPENKMLTDANTKKIKKNSDDY